MGLSLAISVRASTKAPDKTLRGQCEELTEESLTPNATARNCSCLMISNFWRNLANFLKGDRVKNLLFSTWDAGSY